MNRRLFSLLILILSIVFSSCGNTLCVSNYHAKQIMSLFAVAMNGNHAVPAAPGNLQASAISDSQMNLAWDDNSSNESGFRIERRAGSDINFTEIAGSLPAGTKTYSDPGLSYNTTYIYRVIAFNGSGNSSYSNEASATTNEAIPYAPSNLSATRTSNSQIDLTWTDNSSSETGYKIERRAEGESNFAEIESSLPAGTVSYNSTGLALNTTYYYRVRAFKTLNSGYSNVASASTALPGIFFGQTVDIWENFEDSTLTAGLHYEPLSGNNWTYPSTDYFVNGEASAKLDYAGMTNQNNVVFYNPHDHLSAGFWIRIPSFPNSTSIDIGTVYEETNVIRFFLDKLGDGTTPRFRFNNGGSTNIYLTVTTGAWYWITYQYNINDHFYFRVYGAGHSLLLSDSLTTPNEQSNELTIGTESAFNRPGTIAYYDDLVVDHTDATFPLLAW